MNVGDVVRCKAGGPKLVITAVLQDRSCRCVWWHAGEGVFKYYDFNSSVLAPYEEPTGSNAPGRGVRSSGVD